MRVHKQQNTKMKGSNRANSTGGLQKPKPEPARKSIHDPAQAPSDKLRQARPEGDCPCHNVSLDPPLAEDAHHGLLAVEQSVIKTPNHSNTPGLPENPTVEQAEQALHEAAEVLREKLQNDVIQKIGQLVLDEMTFAADHLREDSDDAPSAVKIFEAVRDDIVNEMQGFPSLYPWAASGCLFAKVWEQYVRLFPKEEPWPDYTQAEQWRSVEG
jgi:hypothetical protein